MVLQDEPQERLRSPLREYTVLLKAFDRCAEILTASTGRGYSVAGSVATGMVDAFSDLDLIVLIDDGLDLAAEQAQILAAIRGLGRSLAAFTGTHLGRPDLFIEYLQVDGWVVKVDAAIQRRSEARPLPREAVVVHDPQDLFAGLPRESEAQAIDFEVLDRKFCGWLWYTYAKIARGELFQAARSIDFTRENAVLPVLLFLRDLPQDGHRRIEQRLPAGTVEMLLRSYPVALDRDELLRALRELTDFYLSLRPALARKLSHAPWSADIEGMAEIVERHARGSAEWEPATAGGEEAWYARYYGDDYTLSVRGLLTPERSTAEVGFILETTGIGPPASIADVGCGDGRHARLLAERGFAVTAVDLNPDYIERGRRLADPGRSPRFVVGNMRRAVPGPYHLILSLFNSFGFLPDHGDEETLARWAAELLPGGLFLIDLWNRDAMVSCFQPERTRLISEEMSVRETAHFDPLSGRVSRDYEYVHADGRVNRYSTSFRLYAPSEVRTLFERHGLRVEATFGSLTGATYTWDAQRLVVLARKPA